MLVCHKTDATSLKEYEEELKECSNTDLSFFLAKEENREIR